MTDWNTWSRIVDAAQDPRHRETVQSLLAQAELSADIPEALDEKFLAPRRPTEATEAECAHLLCNLGFAALVIGSKESAAFAMACGQVAGELAPDIPDLTLRRMFLSAKGSLVNAVLTDQPHIYWDDVTERCTTYIGAIDQYLESLPAEAIEGNAMAAYSFAGKTLSQIAGYRSTGHYADEVASLVSAALRLEGRLPSPLASRISGTIMPGTDAFAFIRETGAAAERALQGGEAASTSELPAQTSPSSEQAVEAWWAERLADASEGHWMQQSDAQPHVDDIRIAWGLEALGAAESGDAMKFIAAIDRIGGFLPDSFLQDRQRWAQRLNPSDEKPPPLPDRVGVKHELPAGGLSVVLNEIFDKLGDDTALLQLARTGDAIFTVATRRREGELVFCPAPELRNARGLRNAHKSWSRTRFDSFRDPAGNSVSKTDYAFAELLDEVDRSLGDSLQGVLDDNVAGLVLIGDDLVDIPLHAARTGDGDERLIDRVPVSFVPSLTALRTCIGRSVQAAEASEPLPLVCAAFREHVAAPRMLELDARLEHNARMPFDSVISFGEHDLSLAAFFASLDLSYCDAISSLACECALPSMLRAPGFDLAALFLAAGTRNVLASSWQTENALAAEMTQAFFDYRVAGQSPAASFRQALTDLRSGHAPLPDYLWAGMRLVGAP